MFTLKIENTRGEIFELTNNEQDYAVIGAGQPHEKIKKICSK